MTTSAPVRNSFRQTATVRRTTPASLNPLGQPTAGAVTVHTLSCRAWETTETTVADDGRRFSVAVVKIRVPVGADIMRDDSLTIMPVGNSRNALVGTVDTVIARRGHLVATMDDYRTAPLTTTGDFNPNDFAAADFSVTMTVI